METFFDTVNSFKKKREKFYKVFQEIKNNRKEEIDTFTKSLTKKSLTDEELEDFYEESEIVKVNENFVHLSINYKNYFSKPIIKQVQKKVTDKEKYLTTINKIKNMNITITGVTKNISDDHNKICGCKKTQQIYIFHCENNNFTFDIYHHTSCHSEYSKEYMLAKNIANKHTDALNSTSYEISNESELQDFLLFINNVNFDDYIQDRFSHYLNLPNLFQEHGFKVKYDYIKADSIADFWLKVTIQNEKGICNIVVYEDDYKSNVYKVYIFPSVEEIVKTIHRYSRNMTELTKHYFHEARRTMHYETVYSSDSDFPQLLKLVSSFQDQVNGDYGYFNIKTQKYQNNLLIEDYCNKVKNRTGNLYKKQVMDAETNEDRKRRMSNSYLDQLAEANSKLTVKSNVNNYNGTFDTLIIYHPITGSLQYYEGQEYLVDFYGIRISYDKINPWKVTLTIIGKYYDATKYYHKENNIVFTIEDLGELYKMEGTFDQCFDILKYLGDTLVY